MKFRPAMIQDADLFLGWRNDPETRQMSHNTSEVLKDEHMAWLTKILHDANRKLFIAEEDSICGVKGAPFKRRGGTCGRSNNRTTEG